MAEKRYWNYLLTVKSGTLVILPDRVDRVVSTLTADVVNIHITH